MSSWDTTSGPTVSAAFRKRALKREVTQVGENRWIVFGDPKLGDNYPEYTVTLPTNSTTYDCDCQSHFGGQYRKFCSHKLATIYYRQANPTYDAPEEPKEVGPVSTPQTKTRTAEASRPPPAGDLKDRPTTPPVLPISLNGTPPGDLPAVRGEGPIPEIFTDFRSHQPPAIEQVVNLFNEGYKVVMLEAPTGTGKTLISEASRRLMKRRALYVCTTKTLQRQIEDEYNYAKLLKGRANYPTLDTPSITADACTKRPAYLPACPDCPGWERGASWDEQPSAWDDESVEDIGEDGVDLHCSYCHPVHQCAYEKAKVAALKASLAVVNTAYLLTETNGPGKFSNQDLIILDEADMLEGELMGHISLKLTKKRREELYIGEPYRMGDDETWPPWIRDKVIPAVKGELRDLKSRLKTAETPSLVKAHNRSKNLLRKLNWLMKETGDGDINMSGWVMDGTKSSTITFKPVRVADHAQGMLWRHSRKFLLMSATIVSPEQMAADLGLEEGEWAVVNVPSTFPIQRRPVVLDTVGRVVRKTKEWSYTAAAERVVEIMRRHPGERILVHTVSYELNKIIFDHIGQSQFRSRVVTYTSAQDREGALARYLNKEDGVLLSPSFERGVDLPDDKCRIVVVAKLPFPYLGDKQINARLYGTHDGNMWYAVQTIRTLCQMTGRGMRSASDWCISYILDESFQDLYGPNRRLFPTWWADAVVWDENDPTWRDSVLANQLGSDYDQLPT